MLQWYLRVTQLTREMRLKTINAFVALTEGKENEAEVIKEFLSNDFQALRRLWPDGKTLPGNLGRHIHFGEVHDYKDILMNDISEIETAAERYLLEAHGGSEPPTIVQPVHDVFISYASPDQDEANVLYDAVMKAGGKAFLSSKLLSPGDDFAETIRSQLISSRELWLLVSPNSLKSEWVLTEWGAAWLAGKRIVPIIHRCHPEDLPDRLRRLQCIDFYAYSALISRTFGSA
jgi:TIR domain-containing protein